MMRWWWVALLAGAAGGQEITFVTMAEAGVAKVEEGPARARRRLSPCSTYKIPNAVIGLETGAIPGPDSVIRYEAARHRPPGFWLESWGRDLDLRTAFRLSAVWYFRELAGRVGPERMQAFVDRLGYGNRDLRGWRDPFWIRSTLRISAVEQVEFLDRLFRNTYGLTPANVAAVEEFMRQETNGPRTLFYKTGACTDVEAGFGGWVVGFVREGTGPRRFFALQAAFPSMEELQQKRMDLLHTRLRAAGLWKPARSSRREGKELAGALVPHNA